jgi:hypothetical protein
LYIKGKRALRSAIKTAVLVNTVALTLPAAAAFIQPKLMLQSLSTKPQFTQYTSQDLLLRTDEHGSMYLYVEQKEGAVLAIFDVTDPDHMKLTASVPIEGHGPYDFVQPIGGSAKLLAFRDGSCIGKPRIGTHSRNGQSAVVSECSGRLFRNLMAGSPNRINGAASVINTRCCTICAVSQ